MSEESPAFRSRSALFSHCQNSQDVVPNFPGRLTEQKKMLVGSTRRRAIRPKVLGNPTESMNLRKVRVSRLYSRSVLHHAYTRCSSELRCHYSGRDSLWNPWWSLISIVLVTQWHRSACKRRYIGSRLGDKQEAVKNVIENIKTCSSQPSRHHQFSSCSSSALL